MFSVEEGISNQISDLLKKRIEEETSFQKIQEERKEFKKNSGIQEYKSNSKSSFQALIISRLEKMDEEQKERRRIEGIIEKYLLQQMESEL